jgi:hypothetical protein
VFTSDLDTVHTLIDGIIALFKNLTRHYNMVVDMGHFEVPLIVNDVPLNIFRGTLKCASFTHASKCFWDTLINVPLIKFI